MITYLRPMMQWLHIPQLSLPDIWCCHWKAVNPMITGHLGSYFYTFLTKCLISHGYRLSKCCSKCSDPCLRKAPSYQMKKSLNWWMHLWMRFLHCWKRNSKPLKDWTLTTEYLPGIEFSRCIAKIYVRSLSFIIKKENEGKSRKQAKIAGLNKFLQIYYARVMEIYKNIA